MSDHARPTSEYVIIERAALNALAETAAEDPGCHPSMTVQEIEAAVEVADLALAAEGSEYRRFFLAGSKGGETFILDRQIGDLGLVPEISAIVLARCDYPVEAARMAEILEANADQYDRTDPAYPDGLSTWTDEEPF